MSQINPTLQFIVSLAKAQAIINRRFDARLSTHSMGFNEFIILYHLSQAHLERLRRIDLANQIGLTASAVTRLLAPMEKIGMVSRESNERDARVSFVVLAPGGKRLLEESIGVAEQLATDLFPEAVTKKLGKLDILLSDINRSM